MATYGIQACQTLGLMRAADDSSLGVTAKNSKTLVITLEYPEDQLLYLLTTPPAMPCNKSFTFFSVSPIASIT